MRYEKAEITLRLATELRASSMGLSLDDMGQRLEENFGIAFSRRTIERLRDAVARLHPELEVANAGEYPKRWRLPSHAFASGIHPTQNELTALDIAVKLLRRQHMTEEANQLARLGSKIRSALPAPTARKYELDLQPLLQAEGVALRPGPRLNVSLEKVSCIRQAIQLSKRIRITYEKRDGTNATGSYMVEPYGLLYGSTRPYLIGYVPARRGIRFFSLADIQALDLVPETFHPDPTFSLAAYAEQSFGVFQEQEGPFSVVWKFTPHAAKDARQFIFHPSQTLEDQPDGSLIVRFTACGLREMVWHLSTWGEHVSILEPRLLQEAFVAHSDTLAALSKKLKRALK